MPLPYGWRERVDGDPVGGLPRRRAEELPGPLGLGVERPLEQAEREPARLDARARGAGGRRGRGAVDGRSRRVAALEARADRDQQRPADAVGRPDAGRDAALALEVRRVGELVEARSRRLAAKRVRVVDVLGRAARAELFGPRPRRSATNAPARSRDRAGVVAAVIGAAPSGVHRSGVSRASGVVDEAEP